MTNEQLRVIEYRAQAQLNNDAHWWLWTQELKGHGLKAKIGNAVDGARILINLYTKR